MGLFDTTVRWQVYIALNLIMSFIGSAASLINIAVIYKMKMSGYLLLLLSMSWFQLVYDVTFFFRNVDIGYWETAIADAFHIFGGIGGSIVSNFIAFVVFYIVYKRKSFNIFAHYNSIMVCSVLPGLAPAIVFLIGSIPENANPGLASLAFVGIYYYVRLISIFLNFVMFGISAYCIRSIRSKGASRTPSEIAISTLSRRLIYYPLLQVNIYNHIFN